MRDFPKELIKGKIAEVIFEQMFRDQGEFEVIKNGYEYKNPELAQKLLSFEHREYFTKLRHVPDFLLLSHEKNQVFLVEVKFRTKIDRELVEEARKLHDGYGPCYLFVATHDKFYFQSCSDIVNNNLVDEEMSFTWISSSLQLEYLKILNNFIPQ